MNKYLSVIPILARLAEEYKTYGKIIIAYDFDDTVCVHDKENPQPTAMRAANEEICELLRDFRPYADFILWTCRNHDYKNPNEENSSLQEAENWLKAHDVPYDFVNENAKVDYGGRKIYANIFLDDRAGLASAYDVLTLFLERVKTIDV